MSRVSYKVAFRDHSYLWSINPASDMTGGYVDQKDLDRLLRSPTKATARDCLWDQITYWFDVGPEGSGISGIDWSDMKIQDIARRYGKLPAHLDIEDDEP